MKKMTRFTQSAIILMLIALLAACGSNNNGNAESTTPSANASSASSSEEPADDNAVRTLKDAMGHEVKVPAHPKKVLAPFLEDPLTALGLKPAAQWGAAGVPQQYLQDQLNDVPVLNMEGGMKPEEALSYSPDLIIFLAPTYLADGSYEQFAKIAPTYVLSDNEADWRGNLEKLGALLNEEEAVKTALEKFDKKVEDAKAQLGAIPAEKTAVLLQADGEKGFKLFGPNFYGGETLYKTLGFKQPAFVTGDYDTFSIEKLADLKDVDYIFVISGPGRGKPPADNSLWKSLQAVQNNQVFDADSGHWFNANIIANGLIIDDVLKVIHD
ncbi:ABC transporter substrate-binding protein [Paenibacillus sp. JDR-2]|uniref:ABC transporter substrate-binding protein n=1 Tax=Paenibacillus sp. (strain JDR-2) TaxID=324057 RepID=UPI0001665A49|nr:ABC transporter substrate-binding protein [Paenibacillus sp. JDR-2]ACT01724.1 periplasmic binding protein [Paenibacillus sp. JDR-2]